MFNKRYESYEPPSAYVHDSRALRGYLMLALLAIILAGCAGASVAPQTSNGVPINSTRPTTVYVYDFAVSAAEVTLNQSIFQRLS